MNGYSTHLYIDVYCSLKQKKKSNILFQPLLFLFIPSFHLSHSLSFPLSHSLKLIVVPGREHPWCSDQDSPAATWPETSRPHFSHLVEFWPWGQPSRSCSNSESPSNPFWNWNRSTSHSRRTWVPTSKTSARCPEPRTAPPCHLHPKSNRSTETPPIASHTDWTPNRIGSDQILRTCRRNTHRRGWISLEIWVVFFFLLWTRGRWWWWWLWLWLMVEVVVVGAVEFFFGSEIYYFIIIVILFYCDVYIILLYWKLK